MEFKVILYIVGGVAYFIYTAVKAAKDKQAQNADKPKPVQAPAANPFEEITRELKNRRIEQEAQKRRDTQQPKHIPAPVGEVSNQTRRAQNDIESKKRRDLQQSELVTRKQPFDGKVKAKDVLVHEKKSAIFQEGVSNYESTYERELTAEDKIERGNLKISNEGVYRIETIEEQMARENAERASASYNFDARDAMIGSIILERKF